MKLRSFARIDSPLLGAASYVLIGVCALPTLIFSTLPMMQLSQFEAMTRVLWSLHDPALDFAAYYRSDWSRGLSVLPLYAWGALGTLLSWPVATRIIACASVVSIPLGVCAVLRALNEPVVLALLSLPFMYSCSFYLGLVPSSIALGTALFAIAHLLRRVSEGGAGVSIFVLGCLLTITHPFGVVIVLVFAVCLWIAAPRSERVLRRLALPLSPLVLGALLWAWYAAHADGVAAYYHPSLSLRLLRAPQQLLGGFVGLGEPALLAAQLTVWLWLCGSELPWSAARVRALSPLAAASWLFWAVCVLGYLTLPSSTWTTTAIDTRVGALACLWLPLLVSSRGLRAREPRAAWILLALGIGGTWYTSTQLARFAAEAAPLREVLARVPARSKLICLTYDNQGHVARSSPYVYAGAYAQAERGGALALSFLDYGWIVPLRRRSDSPEPKPVYGSEWDPALLQVQPALFAFYDTVLVIGKEPREMTMFMQTSFKLIARRGSFLLYRRAEL